SAMEAEFQEIDGNARWSAVYQEIRQQSSELPCRVAKLPENKNRNRYRDVSPFDHSRIRLQVGTNDYINASLITVEEARRNYILTQAPQGPLPNTCGSFWEMVWEQRSRGVVMLNRVIEKGSVKCAQYWPQREERDSVFEDTNFKLTFVSEDVKSHYTVRQLELENLSTGETREILHFHYTTWPDFGVPESPASFLNFLFKVRESGCLNSDRGPVVVHCSAGIGRSGTFCLVDTCLVLMSRRKDPSSVRICEVLLEMRRCRMGLIQTADQLRFSYLAVIEGAKSIRGDSPLQDSRGELSNEEDHPPEFSPPPPLPPPRESHNGQPDPKSSPEFHESVQRVESRSLGSRSPFPLRASRGPEVRQRSAAPPLPPSDADRRLPESRDGASAPRTLAEERPKERLPEPWSPLLTHVCLCTALAVGAYVCYRAYFH
uniref:Tyrosine-protein phosphatase non-receptor type n=1 Tax=Tetraodon nigroviridis TaxID=99883 RepID=H3D4K7_TETNG